MKKFVSVLFFISVTIIVFSQESGKTLTKLPSIDVKTPDGKTFNTSNISNDGKPVVLSFWALWCKPCIKELTAISELYDEWQEETGVKLIAVSIDDSRSSSNVLPTANGKGWTFDLLLDENGTLKRAMNVNLIPHTFVINGKGEIVWQHTSYTEGQELELYEIIKKVAKGEAITNE